MRIKLLTAAFATCFTQGAYANQTTLPEKSWFNAAMVSKVGSSNEPVIGIASSYYFAPQTSSGTLDDWGYIDTDSSVTAGYAHHDASHLSYLGGEFFLDQFIVSGSYTDSSTSNQHQIGLGYLVQDNLKLMVNRASGDYDLSAQYQHDLADGAYLGFTVVLGDNSSLGARYFTKVNESDHVTVDVIVSDNDSDTDVSGVAKYYFAQQYAIGAGVSDGKPTLTGNYFFSDEYYLALNYFDSNYNLTFVGQF